jgi:dTDP-glucose 4,6-dehydratase/UDP-glucose 4-epimerase
MKIVIIGSKGFIGQNLFAFLTSQGYSVFGADVLVDYTKHGEYFLLDASNADFHSIFEKIEFDVCINCSGAASVPDSLKNPIRDYYLNTVNVFKILDAIKKYQPLCKFINLSSAAVYGNPQSLPIKEEFEVNLISPYGIHKSQSEQICKEFHDYFGIKTCSLRIFSAYGEGLQKQIFWDLFHKANTGLPFTLFGTGNESRDFIYIKDLVKCIELSILHSNFEADIVNIANGEEIFIKDAVNIFFSFFNKKIEYSFTGNERQGDPNNWLADITKLKKMGYVSNYKINHGLENYYNWILKSK